MKTILTSTAIAAIALIGVSAPALADCDTGAVPADVLYGPAGFYTPGTGFVSAQPFGDENGTPCGASTASGLGRAVSGEVVSLGLNDNGTPNDETDDYYEAVHSATPVIVIGNNSSAFGNGSSVYRTVEYDTGIPDDPNTPDVDESIGTRLAPVSNGTSLGANSHVGHDHSTAIGADAQSTDDHQVTLGTKDETIRAEGIASAKSKARQQGPVEVVTSDSGGRLATDGGEIFSRLGSLEGANAQQWNQIEDNTSRINTFGVRLEDAEKSIAIATAMPDAWLSDSKSFGVFGSVGGTGNETAVGFAAIGRIDETWSINGKLGADVGFDQFGWQVGAGAQW